MPTNTMVTASVGWQAASGNSLCPHDNPRHAYSWRKRLACYLIDRSHRIAAAPIGIENFVAHRLVIVEATIRTDGGVPSVRSRDQRTGDAQAYHDGLIDPHQAARTNGFHLL